MTVAKRAALNATMDQIAIARELERVEAPASRGDLTCLMCVRVAPPGAQRCQACGGTLLLDIAA